MNDYGATLQFGSFITPAAADPRGVVALAVASETAGLDLVSFQDHPYQPAFLDVWTLMSYVAACTERIEISANVHNLPLRPPAVLARAAASLDLLSAGRFALALGTGAFWDAIVAMGGERRSPGAGASDSHLARRLPTADAADGRNSRRRMPGAILPRYGAC
ncbi:alkanesulfonate monooxygenase SsuD/methylene tetrahydromethanopterin reductase-like flavin-dependent oxidoreductase (luciferase family) [Marisediminicola sp. UYEF4]|uniref:LLM class flavin-dependent oxidoreductase n=1 Tax=Marisediminicola sp. UYEF4 TaxID=1756384 RepID=UPI0033912EC3